MTGTVWKQKGEVKNKPIWKQINRRKHGKNGNKNKIKLGTVLFVSEEVKQKNTDYTM